MRSLTRTALALFAALVLLPSAALAQGQLQGVVTDTSGAVLPGVTVEAASPALIEGVRTTVTGGEGRYTVTALRPGTYSVSFILPGFATIVQEGVNVTTAGATTVNATMQVGGLEETVTVTGEAPIVDVTTATRAAVLSGETVDALPTDRNYLGLARLIPGTSAGSGGGRENNIGGSGLGEVGGDLSIHGSRENDQRVMLNGVPTQTLQAGGALGGQTPDLGSAAEVTVEHTAVSAELSQGGLRINYVPRDGGNTFATSNFFAFSNGAMQGSNFTQELQDAGLQTPDEVDFNFDLSLAAGGPLAQDKVWFWFSARRQRTERFVGGVVGNANAFDPNNLVYAPDASIRGVSSGYNTQSSVRLTWQASPRNKIAGTYKRDRWCTCPDQPTSESPEATEDFRFPRLGQEHLEWTSPVSNNLLLEAVGLHLFERWGNMHPHQTGLLHSLADNPQAIANAHLLTSIQDQGLSLTYGLNDTFNNTLVPNYAWRATATYVTGTHNIKIGMNGVHGKLEATTYRLNNKSYRFNNGVPNRITLNGTPFLQGGEQNYDMGLYVQDTITLDRMTLGGAIRYDMFKTSYPAGSVGPSTYTPDRDFSWGAGDILDFTDITWRSSVTYDLFGTGRTAVKFTANKYLEGQTLNGIGQANNPVLRLANSTTIAWNDADGDLIPDCDLMNKARNGECGPWSQPNFGTLNAEDSYSDKLLSGFGNRESNWEYSAGIQHEIARGMSVDVGYFRRNWQNLQIVDNRSVDASAYTTFDMVVPTHPELPGGGGYTLTGLRAITPTGFASGTDNITIRAKEIGEFNEHWQGVDIGLNARLQNGLQFQVGTSTGRASFNDCEVQALLPETNLTRSAAFCDRAEPWLTSVKGYGVYTVPTIDVQVSATFQSDPGNPINADFVANNAYLAANSTLGRVLAGNASSQTFELIAPDQKRLDRRNLLDIRVGKVLRAGGARALVALDLFNTLNSDAVLGVNESFGANWLAPREVVQARVAKISVQFDW